MLCPTTHTDTHRLLREYRRLMAEPPWEFRRRYGVLARDLVARAWREWTESHPGSVPPRTMAHE